MRKKILKIFLITFLSIFGILILIATFLFAGIKPLIPDPPTEKESIYTNAEPLEIDSGLYVLGNNWIRQNRYGLWEMYIEGNAFNRGVATGKLSKHLVQHQEEVFVSQIQDILPSKFYQRFLLTTIAWLNRKLTKIISREFLEEI